MVHVNRKVDDEDFTRELVSAIESVYCDKDLLWEDSVPEEYSGLEDLGVRSLDIPIHIPEDLDGLSPTSNSFKL